VKNVTGFDLVRLYCGSLGTLGVLTRATLRLRARPETERLVCRALRVLRGGDRGLRARCSLGRARSGRAASRRGRRASCSAVSRATRARPSCRPREYRATRSRSSRGCACAPISPLRPLQDARACGSRRGRATSPNCVARPSTCPVSERCRPSFRSPARSSWMPTTRRFRGSQPSPRGSTRSSSAERAPGAESRLRRLRRCSDSLALMRAVKARFDPGRVLAPGRFVGGI